MVLKIALRLALLTVGLFCLSTPCFAQSPYFLRADGVEWSFATSPDQAIIAIGDIHGDFSGLINILQGTKLIDKQGQWAGGDTQLVFMGDIPDRGGESPLVNEFLMRLQPAAAAKGGTVRLLIGNHEAMVSSGDTRYVTQSTMTYLNEYGTGAAAVTAAYSGDARYAKWVRDRNAIIKINDTLFVHAGVESWGGLPDEQTGAVQAPDIAEVNATLRAWMRFVQRVGPRPSPETGWVMSEMGPLWTRVFDPRTPVLEAEAKMPKASLAQFMQQWGVKRIVVGHTPTKPDFKIKFEHHYYGASVVMIDTAISRAYGGNLSALKIQGDKVEDLYFVRDNAAATYLRARELVNIAAYSQQNSVLFSPGDCGSVTFKRAQE